MKEKKATFVAQALHIGEAIGFCDEGNLTGKGTHF